MTGFDGSGMTAFDGELGSLVRLPALVAVTVKVYEVKLVRPVTVQAVVALVQVSPPGDDVAV